MQTTKQLRTIAADTAVLVASLLDQTMSQGAKAREVRDTLAVLLLHFQAAGLMEAYEREGGAFGIV
jgi:hypothetical protein